LIGVDKTPLICYNKIKRRKDMKKLYVNDKLVLVIYDNDLQVDTGDDYGDTYNLDSYIMETIQSNLDFDGITSIAVFRWEQGK
jgi:hypothetical protein